MRGGMNPACDHFFAGAVLAGDQNVGVGWRYPSHELEDRQHGARFCDQLGQPLASE